MNDIDRFQNNLRDERDGAALYAALAASEADPVRKDLFLQLSQAETEHANVWKQKLDAAGILEARYVPSFRTRVLIQLARSFGSRFVLPAIAAGEFADRNKYAGQADATALSADEHGHAADFAVNGRSAWFSATRQVVIGYAAAGVTYAVGALLGVSLS